MHADPKRAKKTDNLTEFFMLLGSARVKAACRILMKLTPGERGRVAQEWTLANVSHSSRSS
jgi:hypothetical protein